MAEVNYASKGGAYGVGIPALVLGALGALGNGALGMGIPMQGPRGNGGAPEDHYVNRFELEQAEKIAQKDAIIAGLETKDYIDKTIGDKSLEMVKFINTELNNRDKAFYDYRETVNSKFAEQSVFNERTIAKLTEVSVITRNQQSLLDSILFIGVNEEVVVD